MVALFVTKAILLVTLFAMDAWLFSFVIIVSNLMLPRDANVFFTISLFSTLSRLLVIVSGALHASLCTIHTFCIVPLLGTLLKVNYYMIH